MIFDLATGLTWLAACYRVWVLLSQPRTAWRASFTAAMVAAAMAMTLYRFRHDLDQAVGVWNLAGLLARVIFAVGAGFLLIYLDALRRPATSMLRVRLYLATAALASATMAAAWLVAPIHDHPLDDLLPQAGSVSVVVYCMSFWAYLGSVLGMMAWTCLARGRTFRREDVARSISLLLIGVSAALAVVVLMLWTCSLLLLHFTARDRPRLKVVGDALLPWPLLINAAGVLSLLTVPYVSALVMTWRRGHLLRPLWTAMITRYPEVHLDLRVTGGPLARLQTRMERALIEIHDALRIATTDEHGGPRSTSLKRAATALHQADAGDRRVADLLEQVDTRDADVRQMLALAQAFNRTAPSASLVRAAP